MNHLLYAPKGGGWAVESECLITHPFPDDAPSGAVYLDPRLDERYAPGGDSPALERCGTQHGVTPDPDVHWNPVYDVPGIANEFAPSYHWDSGAVEQSDIIFANNIGVHADL